MVEQIIENRIIDYIVAAICIFNVMAKIITASCYVHIVRESGDIDNSNGKFIKKLRDSFLKEYDRTEGIQNVNVLVESYMSKVRIAGFKIAFWDNFGRMSAFLSVFFGIVGALISYASGQSAGIIINYVFLTTFSLGIIVFTGLLFNISSKKQRICTNVCNHFENYVFPAMKNGTYDYGIQNLTRMSDEIDSGMRELISGMDNGEDAQDTDKGADEKNNININLNNNEQKIFEEIINEYLT